MRNVGLNDQRIKQINLIARKEEDRKAAVTELKCCCETFFFSFGAIKAELQSNESRRWGAFLSLPCVMSTANGQQMWRYFTSVALENIPAYKSN